MAATSVSVAQLLPPAPVTPTEFEVADVKPTRPGGGGDFRIQPGGRVELRGITLQNLITFAWDLDFDMLADAPKWLKCGLLRCHREGPRAPAEQHPRK